MFSSLAMRLTRALPAVNGRRVRVFVVVATMLCMRAFAIECGASSRRFVLAAQGW